MVLHKVLYYLSLSALKNKEYLVFNACVEKYDWLSDKKIEVGLPVLEDRVALLEYYLGTFLTKSPR